MKYFGWVCLFALLLGSCGDSSGGAGESDKAATEQSSTSTEQGKQPAEAGTQLYPSVPLDTLTVLYEKCDYIDYVFYYTNFSVNQSNPQDIRSALSHIAEEAPVIKPSCKPIGRLFYQVAGDNRLVADLYFNPEAGCMYYVFMEDGKPAYANKIMPAGINFLNNLLERTKTMSTQ